MWDSKRYERLKDTCKTNIEDGLKTPSAYMDMYKEKVTIEDYEYCKAITEALKPLNYDTSDTHNHIPCLNQKKKED